MPAAEPREPVDPASIAQMRELWRGFAREDPMYYVATNRREWRSEDFYAMGRRAAEDVLEWAGPIARERMVEIGCGAGRMLIHFAPHFERVDGLDIAPEMIEAARAADLPENVHLSVNSGADLSSVEDESVDFVFSIQVFQHVPDRSVLGAYVDETARVLRPAGRAVLHFDTRRSSLLRRLAMALPDPLLPRNRRRFIRRYPVPAQWPVERAAAAGMRLVDRRAPGTDAAMFMFERR